MSKTTTTSDNAKDADKDYCDFTNALMLEISESKSMADATRALLREHQECDTANELIGADFLLRRIMEQLDGIALQLDSSSFSYVPKAKATA